MTFVPDLNLNPTLNPGDMNTIQNNLNPAGEKVGKWESELQPARYIPAPPPTFSPPHFLTFLALCWPALAILALSATASRAAIPEPDNLIYGNITLDSALVTAARTDVVIQARRTTNGPAIASYRMGSDSALGNFYSLRLLLESVSPVSNTNASQISQSVFIVVTDGSGLRAQTSFLIVDRGVAQRVDFGAAAVDSDGDGLPDTWELQRYANLSQSPGSVAPNGLSALQNFIAGTDPNDLEGGFRLCIGLTNNQKQVSFVALKAEGPGYEGMARLYTLESNPILAAGSWSNVPSYADITGNNQTVNYVTAVAGAQDFFRGKVFLQGFTVPGADSDDDGLPDAWELQRYANLSQSPGSVAANGLTALQNFIAGTDPNDLEGGFRLRIGLTNNQKQVSFVALKAEGPGYEGMARLYTLESNPILAAGSWSDVPSYADITGNNQTVNYVTAVAGAQDFFRGKVFLQGFTVPGADSDGDGLPDVWETLHFGNLSRSAASVNANGQSALHNFIAGTDPDNANGAFRLFLTRSGGDNVVSFFAVSAQGVGYEGRQRFYSLETSANATGLWTNVTGFSNTLGNNQTLIHQSPGTASRVFFRGKVWLQP